MDSLDRLRELLQPLPIKLPKPDWREVLSVLSVPTTALLEL